MIRRVIAWCVGVVRAFLAHNGPMQAAGLTYYALLAVVPVLCCILVLAKACHVDHYARAQIDVRLDALIANVENGQDAPLPFAPAQAARVREERRIAAREFGRQARAVSNALFERIERFNVGTLGWLGFALLLWTVISTLASVESSFNMIFGVTRARPIWKRTYLYLFLLVVLPVLVALALSVPVLNTVKDVALATLGRAALTRRVGEGLVCALDSGLLRTVFSLATASVTFGFVYWVLPNCRVSVRAAWRGGLLTAVLFAAWLKVCAVAQVGLARSSALYGSFAFLPIVLAWQYMSWQIVLLGANMVKSFMPAPSAQT